MKDETKKELKDLVRETVKELLEGSIIPKGHERCPVCGEFKKIGKDCPWCKERQAAEPKDDVDDIEKELE